jgi:hypothetical protein
MGFRTYADKNIIIIMMPERPEPMGPSLTQLCAP